MYKLHLILKYLRKRRIAWVSLIAVTLCTALVLVVISVMGGWLRMFRESFKGISGDVLIEARGSSGFPYYEEMMGRINQLPGVAASTPILTTFALLRVAGNDAVPVRVFGYDANTVGQVNNFPQSLYRQHYGILEAREKLKSGAQIPEPERQELEDLAKREVAKVPSFKPFLPTDVYRSRVPESIAEGVENRPGMILGAGVAGIRKGPDGQLEGRQTEMYVLPAQLTLVDLSGGGPITERSAKYQTYWIVDDSRTKVYQIDDNAVYVPFDVLQKDLGLAGGPATAEDGTNFVRPKRTSEIHVRAKPGADLDAVRDAVEKVVDDVMQAHGVAYRAPTVYTWETRPETAKFLSAVEKEVVLVTFLFSLISVVAVFLIFCIFYMIVVEKTRDIGIVKSVGATAGGVAQIFLGYGLAIGVVGGGLGFLAGWAIVRNINELHTWMGKVMGVRMWDPEVYAFDTIPSTMDPRQVAVILLVAVVSSVIGSLVPALRAASMNPVDALRFE